MVLHLERILYEAASRWLGGGEGDEEHSSFGVHIEFNDLYYSVLFLTCIYLSGWIASHLLRMPSLVGEIVCGILLGPPLADFVPLPKMWVLLGELGLVLLVLEAGIDVNMTTLKLIGTRGVIIAIVGSILPIAIGMAIAFAIGTDTKGAIAAGATFGPTSLGIAMNVLRQGKIVNTPVGQLIISAAVIDDMIALVILSQLEALTSDITVQSVLIPILSALLFLVVGGYIAIVILPPILEKYVLYRFEHEIQPKIEMLIMLGLLIGLMPATYYAKASFLMGAFLAGLAFCRSHGLHMLFISQFKRLLQWLMRIFFAASIGFQVPIKDFGNGTVIWQGLVFTLALLGKLGVGFLVPNFNQTKRFQGMHLRDCLVTGFSMAAEGEFAFVIAVFAVDNELIDKILYASLVLAVLLSTIVPPFALRFTISYYNKKAERIVMKAAEDEIKRKIQSEAEDVTGEMTSEQREHHLWEAIKSRQSLFLCIQTQSKSQWGLLHTLMNTMNKKGLAIIDHRSWHPRGVDTTLVNEVYAKDNFIIDEAEAAKSVEDRMEEIKTALEEVMPAEAKIKVQRWFPGVVEEVVEEVEGDRNKVKRRNISEKLLAEASRNLEKSRTKQTTATKERTVEEILNEVSIPEPTLASSGPSQRRKRGVRQKMRSTPVGGGLFGVGDETSRVDTEPLRAQPITTPSFLEKGSGRSAKLIVDGETYQIRLSESAIHRIQKGYRGEEIDDNSISVAASPPIVNRLQGYVRYPEPLGRIDESASEVASQCTDDESKNGIA